MILFNAKHASSIVFIVNCLYCFLDPFDTKTLLSYNYRIQTIGVLNIALMGEDILEL